MPDIPYCTPEDLLLGDLPTPAYIEKDLYILNASGEVDAALSARYVVPIVLDPLNDTHRVAILILKRISAHIASARIIMAAAAGSEDNRVHAYARYLLQEGQVALDALAKGNPDLIGPIPLEPDSSMSDKPLVVNADPTSPVDEFYRLTTPSGQPLNADYLPW